MTMCPRCGSTFLQPLRCEAKAADVVVVDGDPFEFEKLKDRIERVYKDGVKVVG